MPQMAKGNEDFRHSDFSSIVLGGSFVQQYNPIAGTNPKQCSQLGAVLYRTHAYCFRLIITILQVVSITVTNERNSSSCCGFRMAA